jgi:death on curing protein
MSEPRWITYAQIVRIHDEQLAIFGGPAGLRDAGLLQSAIDRPRNKFSYGETSLAALAAAYAFGLAKNHPFVDGNKRTAFASVVVFLAKNDVDVDFPQPEAVQTILELAAGKLTEAELAAWIGRHM